MKVGIDSYCYHRYFGEVYPEPKTPLPQWTMDDLFRRAERLQVDGLLLETCFMPGFDDPGYLREVKALFDEKGWEPVLSWGHPLGLEGGRNEEAFQEMMDSIEYAKILGATTMRVVGSALDFRNDPHEPQVQGLIKMFSRAVGKAEEYGVRMAVENHFDLSSSEWLRIIEAVGSPNFGLCFDSANFWRQLEDPVKVMRKMGKYVYATHLKDVKLYEGVTPDEWYFFACTPLGEGLLDFQTLVEILHELDYDGILAFEVDYPHPDYSDEDQMVELSVQKLKQLVAPFD